VSELRIAPTLQLPIDVAGESTAILAKKGAGKSNTAKVIVEEVLDHGGVQVVVLDPIGHWWSLRAGANGKAKGGYPVAVFGGMHGDLPLEPTAGKLLAQTAVESGQSMILDVSSLDSDGAMQRFVYELLEELYKLKQAAPTPLLLVLEEADEFAPQDTRGANVPRMVGAANRISKRGRGRGIGMLYVTQRSAALNKNVLDQSDTLIVMRTIGPRDRAAIESWVKHQQADGIDEVLPSLPELETGEAWFWTPERKLLERVKVRKARTFDSSQTPRPGETAIVADVKPIDVDALGEKIRATVERAKENDPAELKRQLRELTTRLERAESTTAVLERARAAEPRTVEVERIVPVAAIEPKALEPAYTTLLKSGRAIAAELERIDVARDQLAELADRLQELPPEAFETNGGTAWSKSRSTSPPRVGAAVSGGSRTASPAAAAAATAPPPAAGHRGASTVSRPAGATATTENVSAPQQRILNALAALEQIGVAAPDKTQLALFAEASPKSSSYSNNLGHLNNQLGLIRYPQPGRVQLTDDGRQAADPGAAPHSVDELHRYVAGLVGGSKWRLLEQLIVAYDAPLTKAELAERAGASATSSSFSNNLGSLRSLGLIDYPAPGEIVALPVLFMEAT
jgi:hypothetical protein